MPTCLAPGCKSRTGCVKNISFYRIPNRVKEKERFLRWIQNIGNAKLYKNDFKPTKDHVVCSKHFHQDCFTRDIKFEMKLRNYKRRLLKQGSIPTIFLHHEFKEINMDSTYIASNKTCKRKGTSIAEIAERLSASHKTDKPLKKICYPSMFSLASTRPLYQTSQTISPIHHPDRSPKLLKKKVDQSFREAQCCLHNKRTKSLEAAYHETAAIRKKPEQQLQMQMCKVEGEEHSRIDILENKPKVVENLFVSKKTSKSRKPMKQSTPSLRQNPPVEQIVISPHLLNDQIRQTFPMSRSIYNGTTSIEKQDNHYVPQHNIQKHEEQLLKHMRKIEVVKQIENDTFENDCIENSTLQTQLYKIKQEETLEIDMFDNNPFENNTEILEIQYEDSISEIPTSAATDENQDYVNSNIPTDIENNGYCLLASQGNPVHDPFIYSKYARQVKVEEIR